METLQPVMVMGVASHGLASLGLLGPVDEDGRYYIEGERPGPDWHRHGTFPSSLWDLRGGKVVRILLVKQRYRQAGTTHTVSARSPDDLGLRFSAVIVAVQLWAWLDAALGLHRFTSLHPDLEDRPSRRTTQRWLGHLRPHAVALQHRVRLAVLARIEPRPFEDLFPRGLPPPRRADEGWREPGAVAGLHRTLAILLVSAMSMQCQASSLLAEAQRKADPTRHHNG